MKNRNYLFYYLAITLLFCFFTTNTNAQSNTCATATSISPSTTCVAIPFSVPGSFTRDNTVANTSCVTNGNIREDGWVSFVANSTSTTVAAASARDVAIAVYQGGCGGTQIAGACADAFGNGGTESMVITTVVGVTYLIRIIRFNDGSSGNMTGNMCVFGDPPPPPPANDECTGAFDLPVGQFECTFSSITNVNATYSGLPNPTCGGGTGSQDVWYKFIAPAGGQAVINTQAGSITDSGMELYRSTDGTCGTLTFVACDDNSGTGNMSQILEYGLVGGNTYYLRVWRKNGGEGTMNICVQNQYSDCDVSFPLCSSSSFNTNSFGPGAVDSNIGNCFTGGVDETELQSIWLNFEIQTTGTLGLIIDSQNPGGDDYDFNLFRANTCADVVGGNSVSCNASSSTGAGGTTGISTANGGTNNSQPPGPGNPFNSDLNVIAGERYYIVINNFSATGIGFDIGFSGTAGLDCVVLPLELTEFGGEKVKEQNLLHWATAREFNTSHFEIERSSDAMDFIKIGELKSGNKKMENQLYQYWDAEPQIGINYYRLKQVDLDGTFTYTKTIAIDNQGIITSFEIQKMYPNPAQNSINFVFAVPSSNSELQIEIFDSNGKSVAATTESYQKGIQNFNQNLSNFSKGLYILRVSNVQTGEVLTKKFIKK
ncbi:T9SS type A sorting domain-containing protein [Bernardetia sp. MNP-M8]|uniref:T9SS type A sorting domain-containing protein n=1 Tax=Bernardetia sp. MNP-M8 TaxID=3127470 RepID=UPI0030D01359